MLRNALVFIFLIVAVYAFCRLVALLFEADGPDDLDKYGW